jgi:hypothetical protein
MKQYQIPVRLNTPQGFNYTFRDQNNQIIDLTQYDTATLTTKVQGAVFATNDAMIQSPPTAGQVALASLAFTVPGVWDAQFSVTQTSSGIVLWGEPIQFTVVPNVPDLALSQLPAY